MSTVYCYNFELDKIKPQKIYLDTIKINDFDFQVAYLGKDQQAFKDDSKTGITLFEKNLFKNKVTLDAINEFNQRYIIKDYRKYLLNNSMINCYDFSNIDKSSYVYVQLSGGTTARAINSDKDLSSSEIKTKFDKIKPMDTVSVQLSLECIKTNAKKVYYVTSGKCTPKLIVDNTQTLKKYIEEKKNFLVCYKNSRDPITKDSKIYELKIQLGGLSTGIYITKDQILKKGETLKMPENGTYSGIYIKDAKVPSQVQSMFERIMENEVKSLL